jgi:kinesin family protein 18/19
MASNSIHVAGISPMSLKLILIIVRVRPFNAKELPHVTSIIGSPLWVGEGSLAATPQNRLSTKGIRRVVQVVDDRVLVFDPPEENPIAQYSKTIVAQGRKSKDMRYAFDRIFDETCTQEDVPPNSNVFPDHFRYLRILQSHCWMVS